MSKRILVTGGTGFIGRALVARLLASGRGAGELRCLVRDRARARALGLPDASLVEGDLGDPAAVRRAVADTGAVVHLAGLTRAIRVDSLFEVNERGTGILAAAAAELAPGARFVHVSSLTAAGPSVDGVGSAAEPAACRPCSDYGRSKLGGERRVLELSPHLDWCVIRPPIVYGPEDDGTRLLFRQALAPVAVVPWHRRPLSLVHVTDLARALELALDRPGTQGFYPIDGPERLDTDSLVDRIAVACGRVARRIRLPMAVPRAVATLADLASRARRKPSFFNADKMREVSASGWVSDPEPARVGLGFTAEITVAEGLAATVRDDPRLSGPIGPATA